MTAEYGMLPRATHTRGEREAARGKQSGRTQEIQRLIGRSLRAVIDRTALGEMTITLDCDVLNADGGTRCAAITGAWVALSLALPPPGADERAEGLAASPARSPPSPAGWWTGRRCSTSTMPRTAAATADANFVLTDAGGIVEIQATAEKAALRRGRSSRHCWPWRELGTGRLFELQRAALEAA